MGRWKDKQEFKERVYHFAQRLDVKVKAVSVRPMATKWASCSSAGYVSLNAELLEMDRGIGDYVIVHELLHIAVPNHGKLWKSLMTAYLGDYHRLEKKLENISCRR